MKVYVALLEKIEDLGRGCFEGNNGLMEAKRWAVMGHFDAMTTYELPVVGKSVFEAIQENNEEIAERQNKERYFHPLYLIATGAESLPWKNGAPYLAIARVHFAQSVGANGIFGTLDRELKDRAKGFKCKYAGFRTVELSDMIVAVSAEKLSSVMKFALTLRRFEEIGKVYTYAGISYRAIQQAQGTGQSGKNADTGEDDVIELLSMRFSVKSFAQARPALNHICKKLGENTKYLVAGVDDVLVTCKDVQTHALLELYYEWFEKTEGPLQKANFSAVTTRMGVPLALLDGNGDAAPEETGEPTQECAEGTSAEEKTQSVYELCQKLLEHQVHFSSRENWAAPLSALIRTMVRISQTSVLDEFVYIMYEGVNAFLCNMEGRGPTARQPQVEHCAQFAEDFGLLMEHVIRVEGQLSHNPELRPVIYDIPVAMLEYTLAFLQSVSEILQSQENSKVKINFLLVPRLCQRMRALELFQATDQLPGLVLVTIPVQFMYAPETIQRDLCHEISHFVGERSRNRTKRRTCYGYAASVLAAREFFEEDHPALVQAVWQKIEDVLLSSTAEELHMEKMTDKLRAWANQLERKDEFYFDIVRTALFNNSVHAGESLPLKLGASCSVLSKARVERFCGLLEDLRVLFRETYADICMLMLLPVDIWKYVESNICELETEPVAGDRPYEQYAIRLYVALRVSGREIMWRDIERRDAQLDDEMQQLDRQVNEEMDSMDRCIPVQAVLELLNYAEECHKDIEEILRKNAEKATNLRGMFSNVIRPANKTDKDEEMDYKAFLECIDQYRRGLLCGGPG